MPPDTRPWLSQNEMVPRKASLDGMFKARLDGMFRPVFEQIDCEGYAVLDGSARLRFRQAAVPPGCGSARLPSPPKKMADELRGYGMKKIADVHIVDGDRLVITTTDCQTAMLDRCIYAFVIGGWIARIGSSKAPLRQRMRSPELLLTSRWQNPRGKSSTPLWEALHWRECLMSFSRGDVYARQGTEVTTPIRTFYAYLDEESILLGKYLPPLNRNTHRRNTHR